jgi:hypothetical protein
MKPYSQIMNYVMLVKESLKNDSPSILITEMASSSQSTKAIAEMFQKTKYNFKSVFSSVTNLQFKLMITDYSWATMHAAVEIFFIVDIFEHSERVFELSKIKSNEDSKEIYKLLSWIASCASHTMHRFVRSLKKKKIFNAREEKEQQRFVIYCSSLLLNSKDLDQILLVFEHLCYAFFSEYESNDCVNSTQILKSLIKDRPANEIDLKKIIDEHGKEESDVNGENNEEQSDDDDLEFCFDNNEKKNEKETKDDDQRTFTIHEMLFRRGKQMQKKYPKSW